MISTVSPTLIHQATIDNLTDIEKLFIPLLVREGKIKIVPDDQITGIK